MLAGFTHRPVVELSERLAALAPAGLGHAFYGSDGASAIEIALKMSFHYWRNAGKPDKRSFVSLAGSYHGETLGALAVTDVAMFRDTYAPLLNRNAVVPCPDPRRGITPDAAAAALEAHLPQHHATTAALIVEPLVQGASGMVMYDASYLRRARELCTRYGVHLIADEIMTGFGRTGTHVRMRAGRAARRTSCACRRESPAATCRCPACCPPTTSMRRSMPMTPRAASCIRIRTPAMRSPAARRSRCWTSSRRRRDRREPGQSAALGRGRRADRRARQGPRFPPQRHDLGVRSRHRRARTSRAGSSPRRWRANCCCARSAAPSISCRPTS